MTTATPHLPTVTIGSRLALAWPEGLARLPRALAPLAEIAFNLRWTWTPAARDLFHRLDPDLWALSRNNPVKVLLHTPQENLDRLAADSGYLADLARALADLHAHLRTPARMSPDNADSPEHAPRGLCVAYFSAEFGLAQCFQIYSGGLGILAGDHLKSAAELGLPLVGVGLLYNRGYFHQWIDAAGLQHEDMPDLQVDEQPVRRVVDADTGRPIRVFVELPGRACHIAVWRCDVGRVPLYLLDTNLPENAEEDRRITDNLYLGDHQHRIKQEIVLGIGGIRALAAMNIEPSVCHLNEGHSAFLTLERIARFRERLGRSISFDQAREAAAAGHIFTTHTPVPAGIDRFDPGLVLAYLSPMLGPIGLDVEGLLALGRERVEDKREPFSMAVLAIRTSRFCNGVSALHGRVSREMWQRIWPDTPARDVPIGHVTNGIHTATWVAPEMADLYDRYLNPEHAPVPRWRTHPDDPAAWANIDRIPDEDLWRARAAARARLIDFCRTRRRWPAADGAKRPSASQPADLSPDAFTIGFARRFATYKRATLLLRDPPRLRRLLAGAAGRDGCEVQIVIAGKAHPADEPGKRLIQQIIDFARDSSLSHRIVFLEDYDIEVAAHLVAGCDIWLNNPVRGQEASGTSGMKAALNGVVNVSILDGWWDEAYDPELGFAIGGRDEWTGARPPDPAAHDEADSQRLFTLLEEQVLPEFARRNDAGIPAEWLARVRRCIARLAPAFSTHRMVRDYARSLYLPAHHAAAQLAANDLMESRQLSDHIDRLRANWRRIRIPNIAVTSDTPLAIAAEVELGDLLPNEVEVQLYAADSAGENGRALHPITLRHARALGDGRHRYEGAVPGVSLNGEPPSSAHTPNLAVRILPHDPRMITPFIPGLVVTEPVRTGALRPAEPPRG